MAVFDVLRELYERGVGTIRRDELMDLVRREQVRSGRRVTAGVPGLHPSRGLWTIKNTRAKDITGRAGSAGDPVVKNAAKRLVRLERAGLIRRVGTGDDQTVILRSTDRWFLPEDLWDVEQ